MEFQHLANRSDLENSGRNEFSRYRYIGIVEFGSFGKRVSARELEVSYNMIAQFMRNECYWAIKHELLPDLGDAVAAKWFSIFDQAKGYDAFIGLTSIFYQKDDAMFLVPVYREIKPSRSTKMYSFLDSIEEVLASLKSEMIDVSLTDFPAKRFLKSGARSSLILNGNLVKERIDEYGSPTGFLDKCGKELSIDMRTLDRAMEYSPVSAFSFEKIRKALGTIDANDLELKSLALDKKVFLAFETAILANREAIAESLGLEVDHFFDVVKERFIVSSDMAKLLLKLFNQFGGSEGNFTKMRDLLDEEATLHLLKE